MTYVYLRKCDYAHCLGLKKLVFYGSKIIGPLLEKRDLSYLKHLCNSKELHQVKKEHQFLF